MKCTICGEEIVLVPSAAERAAKFGNTPQEWVARFTEHAACKIKLRNEQTSELINRINNKEEQK